MILHISTERYANGETAFCGKPGCLCDRDNHTLMDGEEWCPDCLRRRDEKYGADVASIAAERAGKE